MMFLPFIVLPFVLGASA